MKGDFSRLTFDPTKHYVGVLHQQGRIWLDSDWNEDVFERLVLLQQELNDVIGQCGFPAPGTAFQLSPSLTDPLHDFQIGAGRCYVNGILCQLEAPTTYLTQPELLDPPPIAIPTDGTTLNALVYLEVWQRLITYLEDDEIREVALGGPDTAARLKTVVQVKVAVLPSSITGLTCTNAAQLLPTPGGGTLTTRQPTATPPQDLCKLPDPANFTGRENHLYRVQIHDGGDVMGSSAGFVFTISLGQDVSAGATTLILTTVLNPNQIDAAERAGIVTLADNTGSTERVPLAGVSANGSILLLAQGLRSAYATANNATVTGGLARFKWSRDNAAFGVRVTAVQTDGITLTLSSLGRDQATALRQGDLVEISDDASELGPARGHLTYLATDPDPDRFTVTLADPLPPSFVVDGATATSPPQGSQPDRHLTLRRWDGLGNANALYSDASTPDMNLGDGAHIQFGGSDLRSGDYWQFVARSVDGSIEALVNAPPAGIVRYYCPLSIVSWGPPPLTSPPSSPPGGVAMEIIQDCRLENVFPPLVNFPRPDGGIHVTGLFAVDANGVVSSLLNDTSVPVTALAGGINIQCDAAVDPASISRPTCFLTVEVPFGPAQKEKDKEKEKEKDKEKEKEKDKEKEKEKEIKEKDKDKEKELVKEKEKDIEKVVKEVDKVSEVVRGPIRLAELRAPAARTPVSAVPPAAVKATEKATGLEKVVAEKVAEKATGLEKVVAEKAVEKTAGLEKVVAEKVAEKATGLEKVVVEKVPEKFKEIEIAPLSPSVVRPAASTGLATGAYQPVTLAGSVSVSGNSILWQPTVDSTGFLLQLPSLIPASDFGMLARLTLKGNFIWALNDPAAYLDGEAFGFRQAGALNTSLALPSGDKRRGGDFEMWFWLISPQVVLSGLQATPAQISIGDTSTVTITLSGAAPPGGVVVAISNSAPGVADGAVLGSPPGITVPAGSPSGSFQITGISLGQTTLTASLQGVALAATLTVVQPGLTGGLSLVPNPILVGGTSNATITLTGPAPGAGTAVALSSDNPAVATVTATITVPAGSATATFPITGLAAGQATITATLGSVSVAGTLFVRTKPKEKDKDKEKDKEKEFKEKEFKEKDREKLALAEKVTEAFTGLGPVRVESTLTNAGTPFTQVPDGAGQPAPIARAFIRPEERPEVGRGVLGLPKKEKEA